MINHVREELPMDYNKCDANSQSKDSLIDISVNTSLSSCKKWNEFI